MFNEKFDKLTAYSDQNMAATCNSSPCIPCRRNGYIGLL